MTRLPMAGSSFQKQERFGSAEATPAPKVLRTFDPPSKGGLK